MPRYRLLTATFIAPKLYEAGTVIDYEGPFGPHFDPLDDSGMEARESYYKNNPDAGIVPLDLLPRTVGEANAIVQSPQPTVVSSPDAEDRRGKSLAEITADRPEAGLTDGGTVPQVKVVSVPTVKKG
jgi:hypothetical protein